MKKLLFVFILIAITGFVIGCQQTTTSTTKTLNDASAAVYAGQGATMTQDMCSSMATWAGSGSIGGLSVSGISAKTITGPNANGYYHLVESSSSVSGTIEADIYIKMVSSEGKVTDIYIYGTYDVSASYSGSSLTFSQSYGSSSSPFHATATWSGSDVASVSASGGLSLNVAWTDATHGAQTVAMTYTISSFSMPVTTGADYPTGKITLAATYNSAEQPTITLTFNGTSTATMAYGDTSTSITIGAAGIKS